MLADPHAGSMLEVFIQLDRDGLDRAIGVIEQIGGRIVHAYPPRVIVALIPSDKVRDLAGSAGIESVDMAEIGDERLRSADPELALAMTAWNKLLAPPNHPGSDQGVSEETWDQPGRLPPDAPQHIREMLQQHEREMQSGQHDPHESDG